MKLVVIEDEIRIREGLVRLIGKLSPDYVVAGEAENGKEGLSLVRSVRPEVIVTDIKMPEMDGLKMLELLEKEGSLPKVIVLSAYSEFEYARKAMRMGVKEYLLKPVVVGDLTEALRRVEEELRQEVRGREGILQTPEQIFKGILTGNFSPDPELKGRIDQMLGISGETVYAELCFYLGEQYEDREKEAGRELKGILGQREGTKYLLLPNPRERCLLLVIYQDRDLLSLERWVQSWLLRERGRLSGGAAGFMTGMKLEELRAGTEKLLEAMEWSIALGDEILISYPKITRLQTSPCIYPMELEKQMKLAVCAGQSDKVQKSLEDFLGCFYTGSLYHPRQIKECFVRFCWALVNTGKEVGVLEGEGLEQQKLLERIMQAKTYGELKEVAAFLEGKLSQGEKEIGHLTIKRAQSLIHEFYQTGITLDEIAGKLNLTPEYLGTKFHQEMGVTFGTYMKNFRMAKAKELLIGTSLKLYQIAEKIGYSDPKYFSRVFKEATGQLPADYRKTHR